MRDRRLLIATFNRGKLEEFRQLLQELAFELLDLNSFPSLAAVAETGETFAENARLKASGYAKQTLCMTLADDSGLEVSALGGAPGVRSARFAGNDASDGDRIRKLLTELSLTKHEDRSAKFISAIAVANYDGEILNVSVGVCEGRITDEPRGANGFGFDPIFIPNGVACTFAEMTARDKNRISHRAMALNKTEEFLRSLTVRSGDD